MKIKNKEQDYLSKFSGLKDLAISSSLLLF